VVFILDMKAIVGELDPALSIRLDGTLASPDGGQTLYTVLHADDSGNVRNLVKNLMEKSGRFKVLQKPNGEEAWNLLQQFKREEEQGGTPVKERVRAVISDIEMPQMDGHTLCRKIKENPTLKYLPVALFSSLITDRL
jgi:two-component system chemotaxis response regulator CheV